MIVSKLTTIFESVKKRLTKRNFFVLFGILAIVFGVILFTTDIVFAANPVSWAANKLGQWIFLALAYLVYGLIYAMGWFITALFGILVEFARFNNFTNAAPVIKGWVIVRDIANMFVIIILLVIAFSIILRYEKYGDRRSLPKVLLAAILINYSKTICGIFIDMSQLVMLTFVNGFAQVAGYGLVDALGMDKFLSIGALKEGALGGKDVNLLAVLAAMFLAVFFMLTILAVILVIIFTLVFRIVYLWILVILSPLAFVLAASPVGSGYYSKWQSKFVNYLIVGPFLAFFLWLSLSIMMSMGTTLNQGNLAQSPLASSSMLQGAGAEVGGALSRALTQQNIMVMLISLGLLAGSVILSQELGAVGSRKAESLARAGGQMLKEGAKKLGKGVDRKVGDLGLRMTGKDLSIQGGIGLAKDTFSAWNLKRKNELAKKRVKWREGDNVMGRSRDRMRAGEYIKKDSVLGSMISDERRERWNQSAQRFVNWEDKQLQDVGEFAKKSLKVAGKAITNPGFAIAALSVPLSGGASLPAALALGLAGGAATNQVAEKIGEIFSDDDVSKRIQDKRKVEGELTQNVNEEKYRLLGGELDFLQLQFDHAENDSDAANNLYGNDIGKTLAPLSDDTKAELMSRMFDDKGNPLSEAQRKDVLSKFIKEKDSELLEIKEKLPEEIVVKIDDSVKKAFGDIEGNRSLGDTEKLDQKKFLSEMRIDRASKKLHGGLNASGDREGGFVEKLDTIKKELAPMVKTLAYRKQSIGYGNALRERNELYNQQNEVYKKQYGHLDDPTEIAASIAGVIEAGGDSGKAKFLLQSAAEQGILEPLMKALPDDIGGGKAAMSNFQHLLYKLSNNETQEKILQQLEAQQGKSAADDVRRGVKSLPKDFVYELTPALGNFIQKIQKKAGTDGVVGLSNMVKVDPKSGQAQWMTLVEQQKKLETAILSGKIRGADALKVEVDNGKLTDSGIKTTLDSINNLVQQAEKGILTPMKSQAILASMDKLQTKAQNNPILQSDLVKLKEALSGGSSSMNSAAIDSRLQSMSNENFRLNKSRDELETAKNGKGLSTAQQKHYESLIESIDRKIKVLQSQTDILRRGQQDILSKSSTPRGVTT